LFICLFIILDFPSSDCERTWRWSFTARDVCIKLDIHQFDYTCMHACIVKQPIIIKYFVYSLLWLSHLSTWWMSFTTDTRCIHLSYMMNVIHDRHAMYTLKLYDECHSRQTLKLYIYILITHTCIHILLNSQSKAWLLYRLMSCLFSDLRVHDDGHSFTQRDVCT
jgi:hypothetical protein